MTGPHFLRSHCVKENRDGMNQRDVARVLGITQNRVAQLERTALRKLWYALKRLNIHRPEDLI